MLSQVEYPSTRFVLKNLERDKLYIVIKSGLHYEGYEGSVVFIDSYNLLVAVKSNKIGVNLGRWDIHGGEGWIFEEFRGTVTLSN